MVVNYFITLSENHGMRDLYFSEKEINNKNLSTDIIAKPILV
jgi:hypothetical protein